jgi:addiction module HigA family antidote
MKRTAKPTHPGDVLVAELDERGMSAHALAMALRVPATRIGAILHGEREVTADTALRLARYLGGTAQLWLNLQGNYDIAMAERKRGPEIGNIQPVA